MLRRSMLAGLAATTGAVLACPALAQPAGSRTLVFVPQANLTSLDPIWTTATVTRNYAYMVFDTLYGTDDALRPRPQMAQGEVVDDGTLWTITLRDGLRFHDGTPVLGRDCVASLARWMQRDALGQSIASVLDTMDAPDDRTLRIRLKRPFPPLLRALAKTQPSPAVIMPERIAAGTDPFKQITEVVGSGPVPLPARRVQPRQPRRVREVRRLRAARRRPQQRGRGEARAAGPRGMAHHPGSADRRQRAAFRRGGTGWRCRSRT